MRGGRAVARAGERVYYEEVKVTRPRGPGGPASCLNESESTHCSMNRTLHHHPPAGGIHRRPNYGDEHGLVSPSSSPFARMHAGLGRWIARRMGRRRAQLVDA